MSTKAFLKKIPCLDKCYVRLKWKERKTSLGQENPDKTFFVIRRATCKVGLFSYVMTNMGLVKYALDKGYIPVIDMQNNLNTYLEENEVGKQNSWEYYFEQPCGYSLEDIARSKNIILSSGLVTDKSIYPDRKEVLNFANRQEWKSLFFSYLRVQDNIKKEVEELYIDMFREKRVLGVLCRGTDYINNRPKNHPIQPDPDAVILKAIEVMGDHNCEYIYLATEDEVIYQKFRKVFKDKLKTTEARRFINTGHTNINDFSCEREKDKYLKGKEYLVNILLLAKCNCLIAGSVGGTYGALLMSDGFDYEYVYDLGVY
ncbi:hypothetical protein [Eisenbergiella sp.]